MRGPHPPVPDAATLAGRRPGDAADAARPRPRAGRRCAAALADGDVALDRGADRDDVRAALLDLPGIGPWTADYVAMRALGHPDVFLPTDLGVRDALRRARPRPGRARADWPSAWRPWRSYALLHLWHTLAPADRRRRTDMWTVMDQPVGELRLVEHDGAITAIEFSPFRDGRRPAARRPRATTTRCSPRRPRQLTAYFARELKEFDLPLAPQGSASSSGVGQLQLVGYGETASYGEIAHRLGDQRRLARGRPGQRPQPDPDRDPVPPGHRRQRHPHRLRRRLERKQRC